MNVHRKNIRTALTATATALMMAAMATMPFGAAEALRKPRTTRPNVVLIVLDDVGFSDFGSFGSEIRTPAIDALATDGLRYNRFDTKAVCSATRASLLTGRNSQTVNMADLPASPLSKRAVGKNLGEMPRNAETIAQLLQGAGYTTLAIGKWHLAPDAETGEPGKNGSWPLQRGFDHFYGFLKGWTDQYRPKLAEDNHALPVPGKPGYHFSSDIVDHAIGSIDRTRVEKPAKPFFLYLAFGTAHAPIQVPREYIDRYAGIYEKGWDAIRAERFERMKAQGIIPANTILPPINPGDRKWSELTPVEQRVFARFMATYAGFIEHADTQIGRLVTHLKATGAYDNTLFIVLSDNGAAGEAGQKGSFEESYAPNRLSPEEMAARIGEIGTASIQPQYPRPWAMAGVTPLRRYKIWPYLGGVRTPLILSWPKGIRDKGAIRRQFVDAIDIAPTIADVAGVRFHARVDGVAQIPVPGKSIRASFSRASAPSARSVQFFELRANRAITSGKWRAVAMHKDGTDFAADRWELFDTDRDFSESTDLAAKYPKKLAELKALWWREARKYSTPPLVENSPVVRALSRYDDAFKKDGD